MRSQSYAGSTRDFGEFGGISNCVLRYLAVEEYQAPIAALKRSSEN